MFKAAQFSIVTVSLAFAGMLSGANAFAQEAGQRANLAVTGTVVRIRLVRCPDDLPYRYAPDFADVAVQTCSGDIYTAIGTVSHQPRLGATVRLVSDGDGLRVAE